MGGKMSARALFVGGYDEPLKGAVIAEEARNVATLSPESSLLIIRDHYEEVAGSQDLGLKVDIEYLAGGCFCCSMKHDFELLIEKGREGGAHNFIIEIPLTAELETVKDSMRDIMGASTQITCIFAIDPLTAGVMMETFPELMSRSLRSSDMLAIRRDGKEEIDKLATLGPEWQMFVESNEVKPVFQAKHSIVFLSKRRP
jgi:hypothetical protein